jgi:hypothetical protein
VGCAPTSRHLPKLPWLEDLSRDDLDRLLATGSGLALCQVGKQDCATTILAQLLSHSSSRQRQTPMDFSDVLSDFGHIPKQQWAVLHWTEVDLVKLAVFVVPLRRHGRVYDILLARAMPP